MASSKEFQDLCPEFIPDCVLAVQDREAGKTSLFFLEVDLGTESLVSLRHRGKDIQEKVTNYQAYFRGKEYKRYEQLWGTPLRGFRLLFLAGSAPRMVDLCRLTENTPPSDFIWLTDRESMLSRGMWAPIWVRGGHVGTPLQSILGSRAPSPSPLPSALSRESS